MKIEDFYKTIELDITNLSDRIDLVSYIANISYDQAKHITDIDLNDSLASEVIRKIKESIPVAYITNRREFYGHEFYVDRRVLIPRVETELLITEALKVIELRSEEQEINHVVDLFTGSGVIGITLANQLKDISVTAYDISNDALIVAAINANKLNITDRIQFILQDLSIESALEEIILNNEIILANPPYVSEVYYNRMIENLKYEPKLALVSKGNGLFYYNMLLYQLAVQDKGKVLISEIGYDQSDHIALIAYKHRLNHYFVKDYFGINRIIVVSRR